jgi:hypothetical protein
MIESSFQREISENFDDVLIQITKKKISVDYLFMNVLSEID